MSVSEKSQLIVKYIKLKLTKLRRVEFLNINETNHPNLVTFGFRKKTTFQSY